MLASGAWLSITHPSVTRHLPQIAHPSCAATVGLTSKETAPIIGLWAWLSVTRGSLCVLNSPQTSLPLSCSDCPAPCEGDLSRRWPLGVDLDDFL